MDKDTWIESEIVSKWNISRGKNVRVYVLDSGTPFYIRPVSNVNNIFNADLDTNGHATHICGIITQIAPEVEIIPIKVVDVSPDIKLIERALKTILKTIDYSKINVVNMSFSFSLYNRKIHKLIKKLYKNNVPVVCASGNTGFASWFPAKENEPFNIGSCNQNKDISKFSANDKYVDFFTMGEQIKSTWICGEYRTMSGTSQACAVFSGILALILSSLGSNTKIQHLKDHIIKNSDMIEVMRLFPVVGWLSKNNSKLLEIKKIPWYNVFS